jgi:protein tyrosine phosphatase (PTP) superfamily phosphohydrolase (DUF442 family)
MPLTRSNRVAAVCCSLVGVALAPSASFAQSQTAQAQLQTKAAQSQPEAAQPQSAAAEPQPVAINHVVVDARLHTSGQPQTPALETLAERGFDSVINLAPPTVVGAVADERELLESSGIAYVNIPVDFRNPTYADFERFSEALRETRGGQVLVHCQVNARASTFTFLYRVVHEGVAPAEAFELVKQVWTPIEPWADFGERVLERHGIDFRFP